jgi:adenine-specific DNA-methyltransferase
VRALMDEVFGEENFIALITFKKTNYQESTNVANIADYLLLFARDLTKNKHRKKFAPADLHEVDYSKYTKAFTSDGIQAIPKEWRDDPSQFEPGWRPLRSDITLTQDGDSGNSQVDWIVDGKPYLPGKGRHWRTHEDGRRRLMRAGRVNPSVSRPFYIEGYDDSPTTASTNIWTESLAGAQGKVYVVQTNERVLERCILMTTDPGDLVLDPTCGSGTTAYVAEQWGRRWITIDTSRVALALARARIMGARYPWYLLADSREGQVKEGEVTRTVPADTPTYGRIRQGFVYKRVPHITLKSIANNAEIDTIWEKWQPEIGLALRNMNDALSGTQISYDIPSGGRAGKTISFDMDVDDDGRSAYGDDDMLPELMDWEVPRDWPDDWPLDGREWHSKFWQARVARQREIDASIAAKADTEYLYDQPYEDKSRVRVAGPFTVESLSPHRVPAMDTDDSLFDELEAAEGRRQPGVTSEAADFTQMVLDNLKRSGVQQRDRVDRLVFSSLELFPGRYICGQGAVRQASEGESDTLSDSPTRRAAVFVGPEYGTVARADLVAASREAAEAGFELLIAASFNFDAHASEFDRMGALTVLQARINPDLHMPDLANTGAGNLFTVFGEPDIQVHAEDDGCISIEVAGVDMYKGGEIVSGDADDIAVWFIDTDYNYESFFVRHAYFPGANDPYKALKTTLKAEIDADAWESLKRTRSRPFPRPKDGRVAVKVINHLGDEVMKVVGV